MKLETSGGHKSPFGNEFLALLQPQPGADGGLDSQDVSTLASLDGLTLDQGQENLFTETSDPLWKIEYSGYVAEQQPIREVVNSLANGYMGFRASLGRYREGMHHPAAYIAGLFEKAPTSPNEGITEPSTVEDLIRIPDCLILDFHNGQEWFDIDNSNLLSFSSTLDMRQGVLNYNLRWEDSSGRITSIKIQQFLSQTRRHLAAMRYSIVPENYSDTITFKTGIDGRVDNNGKKYLSEKGKGRIEDEGIYYMAQSQYRGHKVCIASDIRVSEGNALLGTKPNIALDQEQIYQQISVDARAGQTYSLDKSVAVYSSRDNDTNNPLQACRQAMFAVNQSINYDALLREHSQDWPTKWEQADIEIEGDPEVQRAIRFNIRTYALNQQILKV